MQPHALVGLAWLAAMVLLVGAATWGADWRALAIVGYVLAAVTASVLLLSSDTWDEMLEPLRISRYLIIPTAAFGALVILQPRAAPTSGAGPSRVHRVRYRRGLSTTAVDGGGLGCRLHRAPGALRCARRTRW